MKFCWQNAQRVVQELDAYASYVEGSCVRSPRNGNGQGETDFLPSLLVWVLRRRYPYWVSYLSDVRADTSIFGSDYQGQLPDV